MSRTQIFIFKTDGKPRFFSEVKNALRGCVAIWNVLERKYLPQYVMKMPLPEGGFYERTAPHITRTSDIFSNAIEEVWNLFEDPRLSETERICLGTTFDKVIVMKPDISRVIEAFRTFEGETNLKEQAEILTTIPDKDFIAIGWNQHSGTESWVAPGKRKGSIVKYNINTMTDHWPLFMGSALNQRPFLDA